MSKWWVLWCGHPCKDSPHVTREAAEAWLNNHMDSALAAKAPVYGDYRIVESERSPR